MKLFRVFLPTKKHKIADFIAFFEFLIFFLFLYFSSLSTVKFFVKKSMFHVKQFVRYLYALHHHFYVVFIVFVLFASTKYAFNAKIIISRFLICCVLGFINHNIWCFLTFLAYFAYLGIIKTRCKKQRA